MAIGQLHSLILRQIYAQLVYRYHAESQFQQSNPQGATWRDWFLSHTGTRSKTPLIVSLVFIHSCVHTRSWSPGLQHLAHNHTDLGSGIVIS